MANHLTGEGYPSVRERQSIRRAERIDWEIAERRDMAAKIARARSLTGGPLRSYTMAASDAEVIRDMASDYARRCALSPEATIDAEDENHLTDEALVG
jgi:hypothetical protein